MFNLEESSLLPSTLEIILPALKWEVQNNDSVHIAQLYHLSKLLEITEMALPGLPDYEEMF